MDDLNLKAAEFLKDFNNIYRLGYNASSYSWDKALNAEGKDFALVWCVWTIGEPANKRDVINLFLSKEIKSPNTSEPIKSYDYVDSLITSLKLRDGLIVAVKKLSHSSLTTLTLTDKSKQLISQTLERIKKYLSEHHAAEPKESEEVKAAAKSIRESLAHLNDLAP